MAQNFAGSVVNGAGTLIATARALGSGALNTANAANDGHTVVSRGNQRITIRTAIKLGLLNRDAAGTLVELTQASPYTRVG